MEQLNIYIKSHLAGKPGSTLTENDVRGLWDKLLEQNLLRVLILSRSVSDFEKFKKVVTEGEKYLSVFWNANTRDCLGLAWFDRSAPESGLVHFTPFREGVPYFDQIAFAWLEELFVRTNPSGASFIYGHIPCRYTGVIEAAKRLTFVDIEKNRYYARIREDGTERRFPAKVMVTHVNRLRKHLETMNPLRAKIVPEPLS